MIIFFEPVLQEKIWGGSRLRDLGYKIPNNRTGECWGISAHPNGESTVKNGIHRGKGLGQLWQENRELFGGIKGDKFPLLVKIIDANEDLSVQVHPGDDYAKENENGELGKTECWYILDAKEDADMVYGTRANDREQLNKMIDKGEWSKLLRTIPIRKGEFFYIPSGTVHALRSGTMVLEIQQNSDTTYRLYDYDRRDANGELRELHIEKSKEVIEVPFKNRELALEVERYGDLTITKFIESEYFTVRKYHIKGSVSLNNKEPFILMSVVGGKGEIKGDGESHPLKVGDHFMISSQTTEYEIHGDIEILVSYL